MQRKSADLQKKSASVHFLPSLDSNSTTLIQTEPSKSKTEQKAVFGPTFSKAARFDFDHSLNNLGPGLYDTQNSMLNLHLGTKIGLGNKSPVILPHLLQNPGPGSYETVDLDNLKLSVVRGVKFSRSQHSVFEGEIKKVSPSPGAYENNMSSFTRRRKKLSKKAAFGSGDRYSYLRIAGSNAGPGEYEVIQGFVSRERKMFMGMRLGNSKAEEMKRRMKGKLPGPGHYSIQEKSTAVGCIRFAGSKRPEMFIRKEISPGPGTYDVC